MSNFTSLRKQTLFSVKAFSLSLLVIALVSLNHSASAQTMQMQKQNAWWIGVAGGANYNMYHGYTGALNGDINFRPGFDKGKGIGGYAAGVLEYHPQNALFGVMLQEGLDGRRATFDQLDYRLKTEISYFTIEPSLVIVPSSKPLYFYVGPRLGLLWNTSFTYKAPNEPQYPVKFVNYPAYLKNLDKITVGFQAGLGYDFHFSAKSRLHGIVLSPFATYLPSFGRNLRTIENLQLNSYRAGLILKVHVRTRKY